MQNEITIQGNLLDGKQLAQHIRCSLKEYISTLSGQVPGLAVLLVGEDPASKVYVNQKKKGCDEVGIYSEVKHYPETISEAELLQEIEILNQDPKIDAFLVQLPLPSHINPKTITLAIDPAKDADGFHPINVGTLLMGEEALFLPCTPAGVLEMLRAYQIDVEGKEVVVLGRSNIVGKPMAALLMQKAAGCNATVTVAHSRTANLKEVCQRADILIASIGKAEFVTAEMVKEGAIVIDVGINRKEDSTSSKGYRLVGDVDFEAVRGKCSAITPVPGGVGPMTIAMLLQSTVTSFKRKLK